jgi:hypothetical protein
MARRLEKRTGILETFSRIIKIAIWAMAHHNNCWAERRREERLDAGTAENSNGFRQPTVT